MVSECTYYDETVASEYAYNETLYDEAVVFIFMQRSVLHG